MSGDRLGGSRLTAGASQGEGFGLDRVIGFDVEAQRDPHLRLERIRDAVESLRERGADASAMHTLFIAAGE